EAATCAAAAQERYFLAWVARHEEALPPANLLTVLERVAEHYARGAPAQSVGSLLPSLGKARPPIAGAIVAGLARGWPKDQPPALDAQVDKALVDLFPRLAPRGQGQVVELATRWHSKALEHQAA